MADAVQWNTDELKAFAKSLGSDKDGRKLKQEMESRFNSITETLRDRLLHGISNLSGVGSYSTELADTVEFKTKLVGGKNARVSIIGEGHTRRGKWREVGTLIDRGFLYHPAWGFWRGQPGYLRQSVPDGPRVVTDALDKSEPNIRDDIRSVLTDYLDQLVTIRKA